jgi:hypothetical protein
VLLYSDCDMTVAKLSLLSLLSSRYSWVPSGFATHRSAVVYWHTDVVCGWRFWGLFSLFLYLLTWLARQSCHFMTAFGCSGWKIPLSLLFLSHVHRLLCVAMHLTQGC